MVAPFINQSALFRLSCNAYYKRKSSLLFEFGPRSGCSKTAYQSTCFACISASGFRRSRISHCIWYVTDPTKKKHMGRNAKKVGLHQFARELTDTHSAMSEMNAQNAAGSQCLMICLISPPYQFDFKGINLYTQVCKSRCKPRLSLWGLWSSRIFAHRLR